MQLYDIGLLFDLIQDMQLVSTTFHKIEAQELASRGEKLSSEDVLADSFATACLIGMRGHDSVPEYAELLSGIKKMAGFVYVEHFTLVSAILCAAKVAYLTTLITKENPKITFFDPTENLA